MIGGHFALAVLFEDLGHLPSGRCMKGWIKVDVLCRVVEKNVLEPSL